MPRGPSAQEWLEIDWKYPVFAPEVLPADDERTVAKAAQRALPLDQALAYIGAGDPRPLLVLRECLVCNGTDEALLGAEADNEKTILLTRWFHCVKLPVDVMLKEEHPFHALFDGKSPPHLFVCDADGKNLVPLESERSRTELWDVLGHALARSYEKDARASLKQLAKLLDRYDVVDAQIAALEMSFENTIERKGPRSPKLASIQRDLEKRRKELADLDLEFRKASELQLARKALAPVTVPVPAPDRD